MAKFLLVWELGGALGHLAALRALAKPLVEHGHRVTLALDNLARADDFFPQLHCLAAPARAAPQANPIAEPSTFADILHNTGWSDANELGALVEQWRSLFDSTQADVVVCNYAPTAILALQNHAARSVSFGTGFYAPPDVAPLPDLCPWRDNYPDRLLLTEQRVLRALNTQLARQGAETLERVAQLFSRTHANLLTTLPEMDHYPLRSSSENYQYVGPWGELPGADPDWPEGPGQRVFAYIKPMEALPYLLETLGRIGLPTLVFAPSAEMAKQHESATLRVVDEPLDIHRVAQQCDLALLNAGHNATLRILLAGKPVLALPLTGEQYLVAQNVERIGAGICVPPHQPREALAALQRLLAEQHYAQAAQHFSAKYATRDPTQQESGVVKQLERLLPGSSHPHE